MRAISLDTLKPGLVVARPIMDKDGRILLHRNVVLTDEYIAALRAKGYDRLYVKDPEVGVDVAPEDEVSPATRAQAFQALRKTFEEIASELATLKAHSFKEIEEALEADSVRQIMSHRGPLAQIHEVVRSILDQVLSQSTLAGLVSIKSHDTRLFDHSIDVCVVSIMIGRVVGLDQHRLRQLATGCLLHDIGKVFLSAPIDRAQEICHHTRLGYELLKNGEDPDILSPHVALEHHEHQDGTGLPRGTISSNTIERNRALPAPIPTLVGEICAVANLYDNLLSDPHREEPMTVEEALRHVREAAGTQLNKAVVNAFLKVVPVYPLGAEVVLTGGKYNNFRAIVTQVNPKQLDRPQVTMIRDNLGKTIQQPFAIDLAELEEISIR